MSIVHALDRRDINVIMLSGGVIAFFNIIDPEAIQEKTGIPVICVTYEDSSGLEGDISYHFPGDTARLEAYRHLGIRSPITLPGGQVIYIHAWGLSEEDAVKLCTAFTLEGKIPEPLRVARLCARAAHGYHA